MEAADTLIRLRIKETAELNSRLARKDEIIAEREEEIERLESEKFSQIAESQPENLAPVERELPEIEPADLLNKLKARRKKSKAELGDVELILKMIE